MGKRKLPVKTKFSRNCHLMNEVFHISVHLPFFYKMPLQSKGKGDWLRHQKFPFCFHVAKIKHKQEVPPPTSFLTHNPSVVRELTNQINLEQSKHSY